MDYNLDELKNIVTPIAEKHGIKRVSIFGSRARGDSTSESDYDFCIMPDRGMSLIDIGSFLVDLEDSLDSKVDLVCEDTVNPEFLKLISEDRKVLYEI